MTGRQLPPTITPATAEQAWGALGRAHALTRGSPPTRETLASLTAQWALETGWGKQMRCHNIGNVKATDRWDGDYSYFATSERLSAAAARSALERAGQRTDGSGPDVAVPDWSESAGKVRVLFYPSHRACKFRAFGSLNEGAASQVRTLVTSFPTTLPDLDSGNPDAWARALHRARYYTADPDAYAAALAQIHADLMRRGFPLPSGAAPPQPGSPPAPPASPPAPPGDLTGAALACALAAFLGFAK